MRPRIFISHSGKDLAGPATDNSPAQQAREARLSYQRFVRDEIMRLLEPDFECLLDRNGLEPGDTWRAKLHRWLDICDGAVILLDEDSVTSPWVLREATVLMHRVQLGSHVRVVPVFLGDFQSKALRHHAFPAPDMLEKQSARLAAREMSDAHAAQLAEQASRGFDGLAGSQEKKTPMTRWVENVEARLKHADALYLDRAREALSIADEHWPLGHDEVARTDPAFREAVATLAHQLLHSGIEHIYEALKALKDGMRREDFEYLVAKVMPSWVDPAAAAATLELGRAARTLAIDALGPETAYDYIQRASCCSVERNRIVQTTSVIGEDCPAEASARLRQGLARAARLRDVKAVKDRYDRDGFYFVLEDTLIDAFPTLRKEYANPVFVLLTGDDAQRAGKLDPPVLLVQPGLGTERESKLATARWDLEQLTR